MVDVMIRGDERFYRVLGPVFGSRQIEKITHDRFYDDDGKIWYVIEGKGAASVLGKTIKNFWAEDDGCAEEILTFMKTRHENLNGIVPRVYQAEFERAGFCVQDFKRNFVEVFYEKN